MSPVLLCLKDSPTFLCLGFNARKDPLLDSCGIFLSAWFSNLGIEVVHKANSTSFPVYLYIHQVCIIEDIEDWR